jgi:hypothetical protein
MKQQRKRTHTALLTLLVVGALLACKRKADLDPERPLPSVQVPVATTPPPASPTPLTEEPVRPRPVAPAPKRTAEAETETDTPEPATAEPGTSAEAGSAPSAENTPSPGTFLDAAAASVPQSAQCIQKCQSALTACVSAPTDGGLPGLGNARACADAFEGCRSACAAK